MPRPLHERDQPLVATILTAGGTTRSAVAKPWARMRLTPQPHAHPHHQEGSVGLDAGPVAPPVDMTPDGEQRRRDRRAPGAELESEAGYLSTGALYSSSVTALPHVTLPGTPIPS
jgi:hypothetical protein